MNSRLAFILGLFLLAGFARAEEELSEYEEETANDEQPKMEMEDMNSEVALTQNDDPDVLKNKGLCHFGIGQWRKPGFSHRCNCMKCVCKRGGKWDCGYAFAYCPYFYCGNHIYNPKSQICCCGKLYKKKANWHCCGYNYYNGFTSKCCPFFSVRAKKSYCPRSKI